MLASQFVELMKLGTELINQCIIKTFVPTDMYVLFLPMLHSSVTQDGTDSDKVQQDRVEEEEVNTELTSSIHLHC